MWAVEILQTLEGSCLVNKNRIVVANRAFNPNYIQLRRRVARERSINLFLKHISLECFERFMEFLRYISHKNKGHMHVLLCIEKYVCIGWPKVFISADDTEVLVFDTGDTTNNDICIDCWCGIVRHFHAPFAGDLLLLNFTRLE